MTHDTVQEIIPLCTKCTHVVTLDKGNNRSEMIGCVTDSDIKNYEDAQRMCPIIKESTCTSCGNVTEDVEERYSAGIYAGRLCISCCSEYRDNCGVTGEEQTPVEELDEFAYGGYDAIYGEEGSLL